MSVTKSVCKKDRISDLLSKGLSDDDIASELNTGKEYVWKVKSKLKKEGKLTSKQETLPSRPMEKPESSREVKLSGEDAAKVFKMLEEGKSITQAVIDLKLDPDLAISLHEKWLKMKGVSGSYDSLKAIVSEMIVFLNEAREIGLYKLENCGFKDGDFCTYWSYESKPLDKEYKEGRSGRFLTKPSEFQCAVCYGYKYKT